MKCAGKDGHKEINRTNLSGEDVRLGLEKQVVQDQLTLLRMRNTQAVFSENAAISAKTEGSSLYLTWETETDQAELSANLDSCAFTITVKEKVSGFVSFLFEQV